MAWFRTHRIKQINDYTFVLQRRIRFLPIWRTYRMQNTYSTIIHCSSFFEAKQKLEKIIALEKKEETYPKYFGLED